MRTPDRLSWGSKGFKWLVVLQENSAAITTARTTWFFVLPSIG